MEHKFSIITPAHKKTPYLIELYLSIAAQTYENWEWVLWLNNDLQLKDLPEKITKDKRVIIYRTEEKSSSVGYHKHHAFHKGSGDILVEVDHDDLITIDCLDELNKAYQNPEVGFVYSDDAILSDDFVPYKESHGWTFRRYAFGDKELYAMNSWEPSSHSVGFIWYAPDHIRSWRKDVYQKIGGHDVELDICDDHDLLIRTYLETKMYHIPEPLYLYRVYGENTYLERNAAIQKKTVELQRKYAYQLAEKDADDAGLLKVDLGGGVNPKPGYLIIDKEDADINCDLNEGIPLPDNSVGVLNATHILAQLRDPLKSMREIHRVLVHGGWAFIQVPSTDGRGAWQDPTHTSYWNEHSFWYYTEKNKAKFIRNKDIRFQKYRLETWDMAENIPVVSAWLVAIKNDQRLPGELYI